MTHQDLANFIWQIADLLRGPYRPPQYERVMLPMTVLRRFDCVLEPTKADVVRHFKRVKKYSSKIHDGLGDKRRFLDDTTIGEITCEHGAFQATDTCKLFDNADFGYRRVTVERPLRLRFEITSEAKEQFLDAMPQYLDVVQAVEAELGSDPYDDWNEVWKTVERLSKEQEARWTASARKLFRQCFTTTDPEAQPLIARRGKAAKIPDELFPRQELQADLNGAALAEACGAYAVAGGKAVEYETDTQSTGL